MYTLSMQHEINDLKRRLRTEQKLKSKYRRLWLNATGITDVEEQKRRDAMELVVEVCNGFAMALKDISRITGVKYSTVKSMKRKLTV